MFTVAEINLMVIYNIGTRTGLISELEEMTLYLEEDEIELKELAQSAMAKLRTMTDDDFTALDLNPFGLKGW
ncbi:MAG: transposon-transfer assisting family protein [Clostridia bacterium]|nr:transposon-transfer assisting family protein [Clostridia bacterium]